MSVTCQEAPYSIARMALQMFRQFMPIGRCSGNIRVWHIHCIYPPRPAMKILPGQDNENIHPRPPLCPSTSDRTYTYSLLRHSVIYQQLWIHFSAASAEHVLCGNVTVRGPWALYDARARRRPVRLRCIILWSPHRHSQLSVAISTIALAPPFSNKLCFSYNMSL
jgi:hypothetical protein